LRQVILHVGKLKTQKARQAEERQGTDRDMAEAQTELQPFDGDSRVGRPFSLHTGSIRSE
jgi:hypothetical protein